jgi:hypothetical protein
MVRGKQKETPVVSKEETPVVSKVSSGMLINVFNKETALVEKIYSSKLDTKIHFNRNTHKVFTNEEIESFKN